MKKLLFVDVDGTLSSPCYKVDGKFQIGMSGEQWQEYCKAHGEDTYEYCRPVPVVKEYIEAAKADGATLFVLSTTSSPEEIKAKRKFVGQHYPGLFEEVIGVEHDNQKVDYILEKAQELGVAAVNCELIEDTYHILLQAVTTGIQCTHLSTILTGINQ